MLQASLKVIGGKNDGKLIQFQTKKFLVGREADCQLRPNSDLVSRHHCVFTIDDYALRLRDLGSTNGTLVNGRRIRGEIVLTMGDVVRIGKLNLEVVIGNEVHANSGGTPSTANQETTTNASAMETAHEVPQPTTLEESGTIPASPSSDTVFFDSSPAEEKNGEDQPLTESDTSVTNASANETVTDPQQPVQPVSADSVPPGQPAGYPPGTDPQQVPQQQYPQGAWQQYPQYPQYMQQYPQYPPPGYPMQYPPPGYPMQYPPPGQYPPNYSQPEQGVPQPDQQEPPGSSAEIPQVRLPDPQDTGIKEVAKPAASEQAPQPKSDESTPSQSAADLINTSRRRRRADE